MIIFEDGKYEIPLNRVIALSIQNDTALAVWVFLVCCLGHHKIPGWEEAKQLMQKHFSLSQTQLDKAIKILEDSGLLRIEQLRTDDGKPGRSLIHVTRTNIKNIRNE